MHFSAFPLVATILPVALAQYGSGSDSSGSGTTSANPSTITPASSTSGTIHTVKVGNGSLTFQPSDFKAAVGDKVEFHFYPNAHSVAQSSFAKPCAPLNDTAFFSGGIKTASGVNANTFTIEVNNTSPIWFYCGVPTHCQAGMAGVINAPSDKTLTQYVAAAKNVGTTTAPASVQGGVIGPAQAQSSGTSSSSTSSSTGSPTSSGAGSSATKNSGVESRGAVQWTLFAFTGAVAVGVGSMMV